MALNVLSIYFGSSMQSLFEYYFYNHLTCCGRVRTSTCLVKRTWWDPHARSSSQVLQVLQVLCTQLTLRTIKYINQLSLSTFIYLDLFVTWRKVQRFICPLKLNFGGISLLFLGLLSHFPSQTRFHDILRSVIVLVWGST